VLSRPCKNMTAVRSRSIKPVRIVERPSKKTPNIWKSFQVRVDLVAHVPRSKARRDPRGGSLPVMSVFLGRMNEPSVNAARGLSLTPLRKSAAPFKS
jgi:hypothetical protein